MTQVHPTLLHYFGDAFSDAPPRSEQDSGDEERAGSCAAMMAWQPVELSPIIRNIEVFLQRDNAAMAKELSAASGIAWLQDATGLGRLHRILSIIRDRLSEWQRLIDEANQLGQVFFSAFGACFEQSLVNLEDRDDVSQRAVRCARQIAAQPAALTALTDTLTRLLVVKHRGLLLRLEQVSGVDWQFNDQTERILVSILEEIRSELLRICDPA
jgi:hypothetical protein